MRGGSPDGEVVGDFEMGNLVKTSLRKGPTIYIREQEYKMSDLIHTFGGSKRWMWKPPQEEQALGKQKFEWVFPRTSGEAIPCKLSLPPYTLLATYSPHLDLRQRGRPAQLPTLEVTPAGHKYFDEIVFSLLIIEGKRHQRTDL